MFRLAAAVGIVLALATTTTTHTQATITGKWEGATDGGSSIVLNLSVKGAVLTGTMERLEQTLELAEGNVSQNGFAFTVTMNNQVERFSGRLEGDQLKVWLDRQGETKSVALKRVKSGKIASSTP